MYTKVNVKSERFTGHHRSPSCHDASAHYVKARKYELHTGINPVSKPARNLAIPFTPFEAALKKRWTGATGMCSDPGQSSNADVRALQIADEQPDKPSHLIEVSAQQARHQDQHEGLVQYGYPQTRVPDGVAVRRKVDAPLDDVADHAGA